MVIISISCNASPLCFSHRCDHLCGAIGRLSPQTLMNACRTPAPAPSNAGMFRAASGACARLARSFWAMGARVRGWSAGTPCVTARVCGYPCGPSWCPRWADPTCPGWRWCQSTSPAPGARATAARPATRVRTALAWVSSAVSITIITVLWDFSPPPLETRTSCGLE